VLDSRRDAGKSNLKVHMLHALRSLAVLLILFAGAARAAETKPFAREDMASDAVRLTETLRVATAAIGAQVKGKTPQ
jgi:hypothetical protein